jgi:hypothetical protein
MQTWLLITFSSERLLQCLNVKFIVSGAGTINLGAWLKVKKQDCTLCFGARPYRCVA